MTPLLLVAAAAAAAALIATGAGRGLPEGAAGLRPRLELGAADLDRAHDVTRLGLGAVPGTAAVWAPADLTPGAAARLAADVASARADVERALGLPFRAPARVYLVHAAGGLAPALERAFGTARTVAHAHAHASGAYDARTATALVAIDAPGTASALRHELAHALAHQYGATDLPLWLSEGLAEFAARPAEPAEPALLARLAQGRPALAALRTAGGWLRARDHDGAAAYEVSRLAARGALEALGLTAGALVEAAGAGGLDAVLAPLGLSLAGLERAALGSAAPALLTRGTGGPVEWTLLTAPPRAAVAVRIAGPGYDLRYDAVADAEGLVRGTFGRTAPAGEYLLETSWPGGSARATLRVEEPGGP